MKIQSLLAGTHVVAALVGAAVASTIWLMQWRHAVQGATLRNDAAVSAHYGALVDARRQQGDEAEYARALRAYVMVLDSILQRESRSGLYTSVALDKAVTLTRLAAIERKTGQMAEAADHLKKAAVACSESGSAYCTPENLAEWASRPPSSATAEQAAK